MKKPPAIIVDVDGSLVDVRSTRRHVLGPEKDFVAFHSEAINCPPIPETIEACISWHTCGFTLLVVTARKYRWFTDTENWLIEHLPVPYEGPFMRGDDDNRPDYEIKREIFGQLDERFEICHAIDDNPKVIALWEELGLTVTTVPGWDDDIGVGSPEGIGDADAEFIAHARTAVPALVAAIERVQGQVDKTLEILDRYNHSDDGDLPECAPEDRWRLYRDLLATLNPEALETP